MKLRNKVALRFAIAGFFIGEALCAYAFYITSHGIRGNVALFLLLCPPSIGAMALDSAGVVGGMVGWMFISAENAGLYALVGWVIGRVAEVESK